MSIHDLPNELLDEIFAYLHPLIEEYAIIPIHTVCQRWNRPFMTQHLHNIRLPANIDLQAKFPKLTYFAFSPELSKHCKDFSFFKGHSFLKELVLDEVGLVASVLNCPRLTSLTLHIDPGLFLEDDHLELFLALLPRLERLNIHVFTIHNLDPEFISNYNQKMATILARRPKCQLKLKSLTTRIFDVDLVLFFQLLQTSSLDHFETWNELKTEQIRKSLGCFPQIRSLETHYSSFFHFNEVIFEHVTKLMFTARFVDADRETLSLSLLMNQFPNAESLQVYRCPIIFDLKYPTRLTHLTMSFIGPVHPRMFLI